MGREGWNTPPPPIPRSLRKKKRGPERVYQQNKVFFQGLQRNYEKTFTNILSEFTRLIIMLVYSTCQGYFPISVSLPPTILFLDSLLFGTPQP